VRVYFKTHRLIPSRFPTVDLFDWASSAEELAQIALLEGLTNDRLKTQYGDIHLVPAEDWVSGPGSTPVMAAFTHPYPSRFSDGTYGVYYAAESLKTAIAETRFHRERFLKASQEPPCLVQMREYIARVKKPLVDLRDDNNQNQMDILNPDVKYYQVSQSFGAVLKQEREWGMLYPSVRRNHGLCVAILRPRAIEIPQQGCHLEYIWDGERISEVRMVSVLQMAE
jgi:hypothetical protein